MRELHARLHVEGLSDGEASRLPVRVVGASLARMEISTWRTNGGDLDVLADIPDRAGRHTPTRSTPTTAPAMMVLPSAPIRSLRGTGRFVRNVPGDAKATSGVNMGDKASGLGRLRLPPRKRDLEDRCGSSSTPTTGWVSATSGGTSRSRR